MNTTFITIVVFIAFITYIAFITMSPSTNAKDEKSDVQNVTEKFPENESLSMSERKRHKDLITEIIDERYQKLTNFYLLNPTDTFYRVTGNEIIKISKLGDIQRGINEAIDLGILIKSGSIWVTVKPDKVDGQNYDSDPKKLFVYDMFIGLSDNEGTSLFVESNGKRTKCILLMGKSRYFSNPRLIKVLNDPISYYFHKYIPAYPSSSDELKTEHWNGSVRYLKSANIVLEKDIVLWSLESDTIIDPKTCTGYQPYGSVGSYELDVDGF